MKSQNGFTLIELVIVIVLLGVLAAIAVPRFVNLGGDANRAALNATATSISSAMNINYAACAVAGHVASATGDCRAVSTCEGATGADAVMRGGASALTGYTVTAGVIAAGNGTTASCQITKNGYTGTGSPATFTAVRAGTP